MYSPDVSTVGEIEPAIAQLPQAEFWKIADRVIQMREEAWDRQIKADAESGKLDKLFEEADREFDARRVREL